MQNTRLKADGRAQNPSGRAVQPSGREGFAKKIKADARLLVEHLQR